MIQEVNISLCKKGQKQAVYYSLILSMVCLVFYSDFAFSQIENAPLNVRCEICFTPQKNCTQKIVEEIKKARKSIYVQVYAFTSKPILEALLNAHHRGVQLQIILDKSHYPNSDVAKSLTQNQISVWIDRPAGIAHNKVMIIDNKIVITGSFNFTYAAQYRNRENILIIQDKKLAQAYLQNWKLCQEKSISFLSTPSKRKKSTWGRSYCSFFRKCLNILLL